VVYALHSAPRVTLVILTDAIPKIEDTSIMLYDFYVIRLAVWAGHLQQNEKVEAVKPDLHHDPYTL